MKLLWRWLQSGYCVMLKTNKTFSLKRGKIYLGWVCWEKRGSAIAVLHFFGRRILKVFINNKTSYKHIRLDAVFICYPTKKVTHCLAMAVPPCLFGAPLAFAERHHLTIMCCPMFMDVGNLGSSIEQQPLYANFLILKCILIVGCYCCKIPGLPFYQTALFWASHALWKGGLAALSLSEEHFGVKLLNL